MSNSRDGELLARNRIKAPGVAWSEEEAQAMRDGVSPDDIREGKWKPAKAPKTEEPTVKNEGDTLPEGNDLSKLKKDELLAKASELKVVVPLDATKAEIIEAITKANNPQNA